MKRMVKDFQTKRDPFLFSFKISIMKCPLCSCIVWIVAVSFSSSCAKEVAWMFGYLDSDEDGQLSMAELYALEHNEREHCLKPFIDQCDENR